jgi:hypothetical protein
MHLQFSLVFAVALGMAAPSFAQEPISVGDPLPTLALKDQHDKPYELPADTRRVLFVADNGGTALATQMIEGHEPDWLAQNKQVFVADIHKMPRLVASLIALPQLREKPYRILLGRDATDLQMFPRRKDCVTVITADDGKIVALTFACNRDELQAASAL